MRKNCIQTFHTSKIFLYNNAIWWGFTIFFDFCGFKRPASKSTSRMNYFDFFCSFLVPLCHQNGPEVWGTMLWSAVIIVLWISKNFFNVPSWNVLFSLNFFQICSRPKAALRTIGCQDGRMNTSTLNPYSLCVPIHFAFWEFSCWSVVLKECHVHSIPCEIKTLEQFWFQPALWHRPFFLHTLHTFFMQVVWNNFHIVCTHSFKLGTLDSKQTCHTFPLLTVLEYN